MQLIGKRSLAWGLKWITDAAILGLFVLLLWVLVIMAGQHAPQGSHGQQATIELDLKLPTDLVEPVSTVIEVANFESTRSVIHFRTKDNDWYAAILRFSQAIVGFGVLLWILWLLRQILSSLVAGKPLTLANARRFKGIGFLIVFVAVFSPLQGTLGYLHAQELFQLLPPQGYFRSYVAHFELTRLFQGLLMVLMAEVMRLGAEHRADSEAVI